MKRADRVTTIVLTLMIVFYLVVASGYPGSSRTIPLILGGVALTLAVIQLLAPLVSFLAPVVGTLENEEAERILSESKLRRRFYAVSLSLILVPVSIAVIGLVLTLPLYVAIFTALDRQRPVFVAVTTAAVAASSYGLLVVLIAMPWNGGYLFGGL